MRERQLFSGPLFDIAEFACPPQDEAWRDVNVIQSASPLVVFPHTTVGIHPGGAAPVLATPMPTVVWMSWPHTWAGALPPPICSSGGTASISAR